MAILLSHEWKHSAMDKWYKIVIAELGKLRNIIS